MVTKMRLDKIKILPAFQACPPRQEKVEAKLAHYKKYGRYDRDLQVDRNGWLVDGYATYLVMRANNEQVACVGIAENVWPAAACEDGSGNRDWYQIPMKLARKLRPGQGVLLFANGKLGVQTVRNLELFSGRPCWPARGLALPSAFT